MYMCVCIHLQFIQPFVCPLNPTEVKSVNKMTVSKKCFQKTQKNFSVQLVTVTFHPVVPA